MITATITLWRRDTGAKLDTLHYEVEDWREIIYRVRGWLSIEVNPYWRWGSLGMTWETDDQQVAAGLFGIAVCFGASNYDPR
jgi:hypothetical protein